MATTLFLICLASLLFVWDITIKLLAAVSYRAARRFIDLRLMHMAYRLVKVARCYVGLRFEMESHAQRNLPSSFLLVCNHQSVADIVALLAYFPEHALRFVAKRELRHWLPAVSWVLRIQRHALIHRGGHGPQTMRQLRSFAKRCKRYGNCPVIFAEGTRSRDGRVRAFHAGAVRTILAAAPLPVVSVAVDGGYHFSTFRRLATHARGGYYRIRVLSVYPAPQTKEAMRTALDGSHREIRDQVELWRSEKAHV